MGFYSSVFNTTINPTELNKRSFAATLLRLYPDGAAPIFALTGMLGRSKAVSSTHGYFTKTLAFAYVTINQTSGSTNGYNPSNTTFEVADSTSVIAGMVLYNPTTKENMRISSVTDATHIVVTRAFGRVAAAAISGTQKLVAIGSAYAEGSARPTARGLTTVYVANYTQIFRNAWALTGSARASATEMGFTNIQESRKDCAMLHSVEIESALIFGQPKMDTSGSQPLHATQGIVDATEQYASGNIHTASATTSLSTMIGYLEGAWTYSHDLGDSKQRVAYCGATAMKVFNEIARKNGTVQILPQQNTFGFRFTKFDFYKGAINLVEHPLLNGIQSMGGMCLGVDMPAIKLAYMDGRDTRPEEYGGTGNNNANGVDAEGGSLTTEFAMEDLNPNGNFVIYGMTAGVADS